MLQERSRSKLWFVAGAVSALLLALLVGNTGASSEVPGLPFDLEQAQASPEYLLAQTTGQTTGHRGRRYIKIGSIQGESDRDGREDGWIDVLSMDWGVRTSGGSVTNGGTLRRGGPEHKPVNVVKHVDKASPLLARALVRGEVLRDVTIDFTTPGEVPEGEFVYLKIELTNAVVSSYELSSTSDEDTPTESLSLNFERIKVTYTPFDPQTGVSGAPVVFEYDFARGQ